jgi:hypothetical protein
LSYADLAEEGAVVRVLVDVRTGEPKTLDLILDRDDEGVLRVPPGEVLGRVENLRDDLATAEKLCENCKARVGERDAQMRFELATIAARLSPGRWRSPW